MKFCVQNKWENQPSNTDQVLEWPNPAMLGFVFTMERVPPPYPG